MTITVTITSDFICPWCLIGERRLSKAIDSLPDGTDVELKWLPFELNSEMRPEGMDRKTYRSLKFGSWERSQLIFGRLFIRSATAELFCAASGVGQY